MLKKNHYFTIVSLCIATGFGVYRFFIQSSSARVIAVHQSLQNNDRSIEMLPYDASRDKEFIKQQFKENWYLLISSPDYDIDHMLDTRSPHKLDIKHLGSLIIKVLYYNNQPAGFGACYMDSKTRGDILFVEVAKEFRGKKLAESIVKTQIEDLKKEGALSVKLATRTDNKSAQKLYLRLGFKETHRSNEHVYYRIDF